MTGSYYIDWWNDLKFEEKNEIISIWKETNDGFPDARKEWGLDDISRSQQLIHELYNEFKLK
jgi:hypothetical protein